MFSLKKLLSEVHDHNLLEIDDELVKIIYCDMDGVLVDFESGFKQISGNLPPSHFDKSGKGSMIWDLINKQPKNGIDWWTNLPKLNDADALWKFISSLKVKVKILSSTSSRTSKSNSAEIGKRIWLAKNLNPIPTDDNIILVDSADMKRKYALGPNHILIDDFIKNINQWRSEGGVGIRHTSALDTISQLKKILGQQDESYGYSWSNR